MKKLLTILILIIGINAYSQDWVTNLQMQVGTWKAVGITFRGITDSATISSFNKVYASMKTKPNNEANMTLDSIPTLSLVLLYETILFNVGYSSVLSDFQTSIQSKRNTNALLDARCDELEARLATLESQNIANGGQAYGVKSN